MKPRFFALTVTLIFVLSSCSTRLSYFTQDLYAEYNWTDNDWKKIQFYISNDIFLRRELSGVASEINSGKIRVENGRWIEEVIIPKRTPSAFIFSPKTERFAVSFDEGNDIRYPIFGPNPKFNDRYVLLASERQKGGGKAGLIGSIL